MCDIVFRFEQLEKLTVNRICNSLVWIQSLKRRNIETTKTCESEGKFKRSQQQTGFRLRHASARRESN